MVREIALIGCLGSESVHENKKTELTYIYPQESSSSSVMNMILLNKISYPSGLMFAGDRLAETLSPQLYGQSESERAHLTTGHYSNETTA